MSLNKNDIAKARKKIQKKGYYWNRYLDVSKQLDEIEAQVPRYGKVAPEVINRIKRLSRKLEYYFYKTYYE